MKGGPARCSRRDDTRLTPELIERHAAAGYWSDTTLADVLRRNARERPDKVASIDDRLEVTWGTFWQVFGELASGLARRRSGAETSSRSRELGPHGITVNTLCPGRIDTPRWEEVKELRQDSEEAGAFPPGGQLLQEPVGRIGRPEKMAAVISFPVSDHAAFLTGLTIPVDGGALQSLF